MFAVMTSPQIHSPYDEPPERPLEWNASYALADALQHLLSSYRLSRLQVSTPRECTIASALARRVGSWQLVEWLQAKHVLCVAVDASLRASYGYTCPACMPQVAHEEQEPQAEVGS